MLYSFFSSDNLPLTELKKKTRKKQTKLKLSKTIKLSARKSKASTKIAPKSTKDSCDNDNPIDNETNETMDKEKSQSLDINEDDEGECGEKCTAEENKANDEFIAKHIKLKCEICEAESATFIELKHHFTKMHKCNGYIQCCNKRLDRRYKLVDHIKLHLDPNFFA